MCVLFRALVILAAVSGCNRSIAVDQPLDDAGASVDLAASNDFSQPADQSPIVADSGLSGMWDDLAVAQPLIDPARCTVTIDRAIVVADGIDHALVSVTVRSTTGATLPGHVVEVALSGSANTVGPPAVTDANGLATFSISSTRAEQKTVSGMVDGVAVLAHPTVLFVPGPPIAPPSGVTVMPANTLADGKHSLQVTTTWDDAHGNPVSGISIGCVATGANNTFVPAVANGVTDGAGQFLFTISSTTAGPQTITCSAGGLQLTAKVQFDSIVPAVTALSTAGNGGCVSVSYGLQQAAASKVDVVVEYSQDGVFHRATQAGSTTAEGIVGLKTQPSPSAAAHVFLWNSTANLPNLSAAAQVRVTPYIAGRAGTSSTTNISLSNGEAFLLASSLTVGTGLTSGVSADVNGDGNADLVLAGSAASVEVLLGSGNGTFFETVSTAIGQPASQVALGDFNGDGRADLVLTHGNGSSITVMSGNADGSFQAPGADLAVGQQPAGVVVADFNRDGKLDIVTANAGSSNVSVVLGNGNGTFQSSVPIALGTDAGALVAADLNRDGKLDIATAGSVQGEIAVLLGDGSGGFQSARRFSGGGSLRSLVAGDFDRDGRIDLAAANDDADGVSVLRGRGDGTFRAPATFAAGRFPGAIQSGDFDGDGKADLLVTSAFSGAVETLLGNGDATFRPPVSHAVLVLPSSIILTDLNCDGQLDVVTTHAAGPQLSILMSARAPRCGTGLVAASEIPIVEVSRLLSSADFDEDGKPDLAGLGDHVHLAFGDGDGNFSRSASSPYGGVLTVADFDDDGHTDIVVNDDTSSTCKLTVLWGHGDGTFQPLAVGNLGCAGEALSADMNVDGKQDLVLDGSVVLGNGNRTFQPPKAFTIPQYYRLGPVADFDGDAKPDVVLYPSATEDQLIVLHGVGDGTLGASTSTAHARYDRDAPAVMDFNKDEKLDLVMVNVDNTQVYLGDGNGAFVWSYALSPQEPSRVVAGDFDGDGNADLIFSDNYSPFTQLFAGHGDGTFQDVPSPIIGGGSAMTVGDFDQDGHADIGFYGSGIGALLSHGDGTFDAPAHYLGVDRPSAVATGDFDGDGHQDVAVADRFTDMVRVRLGDGTGKLEDMASFPCGSQPMAIIAVDVNRDGVLDLVTVNYGSSDFTVLTGDGTGAFGTPMTWSGPASPDSIATGDLNRDGLIDLVIGGSRIFLGQTDGTFIAAGDIDSTGSVGIGDLDGDGIADLAVSASTFGGPDGIRTLKGVGDGTFIDQGITYVAGGIKRLALGDYNGDGHLDVVASTLAREVIIAEGLGDGTFEVVTDVFLDDFGGTVVPLDLNRDGKLDVVMAASRILVFIGNGDGSLQPPVHYPITQLADLAVADFNGDSVPDLVSVSFTAETNVLLGK